MRVMEEQEKNIETKQRKGAAPEAANREEERNQVIVRTSVVGIAANVLLAVFKAIVGAASGSIAIVLDAVNNLSDAASSLITIVGTKLAGKQPDRKHPFGYGRIAALAFLYQFNETVPLGRCAHFAELCCHAVGASQLRLNGFTDQRIEFQ